MFALVRSIVGLPAIAEIEINLLDRIDFDQFRWRQTVM